MTSGEPARTQAGTGGCLDRGITRQEHLQRLPAFLNALSQSLESALPNGPKAGELLRTALDAECVQCGMRLNGEPLAILALPAPAALPQDPRVMRLRQGYCARNGCDSYYYRLQFRPVSGVSWERVLAAAADRAWEEPATEARPPCRALWGPDAFRQVARGLIVLFVLGTILLARQWYLGGTIPFLRQPEKFEVDHSGIQEVIPPCPN